MRFEPRANKKEKKEMQNARAAHRTVEKEREEKRGECAQNEIYHNHKTSTSTKIYIQYEYFLFIRL